MDRKRTTNSTISNEDTTATTEETSTITTATITATITATTTTTTTTTTETGTTATTTGVKERITGKNKSNSIDYDGKNHIVIEMKKTQKCEKYYPGYDIKQQQE